VAGREAWDQKRRWFWKKLHLSVDADTDRIAASELTGKDNDDGSQVGSLLDQADGPAQVDVYA
jgi:hypothetical protein